jgi:hypothetical protein
LLCWGASLLLPLHHQPWNILLLPVAVAVVEAFKTQLQQVVAVQVDY